MGESEEEFWVGGNPVYMHFLADGVIEKSLIMSRLINLLVWSGMVIKSAVAWVVNQR